MHSCRKIKKKLLSAHHAEPHCPSLQTGWFPVQVFPQDPQFVLFVLRLTHASPQGVVPGTQPTIVLPCMDAVWTEGTISAAVAAGWVFAESAELVFVSIQPAVRARTGMMRARISIVRIRIGTPPDTSDSTLKNILIGQLLLF